MQATDRFGYQVRQVRRGRTPRQLPRSSTSRRGPRWLGGRSVALALLAAFAFAVTGLSQVPTPGAPLNSLPPPPGVGGMTPVSVETSRPASSAGIDRPVPAPAVAAQAGPPGAPGGTVNRPVVSDIIIRDNRHLSAEYIKNVMKTRVGKEFSSDTLQEDVRALYATRQFGNVYADKEDAGFGRVRVIVYIRDYPSVISKITFQGANALNLSDLEELTGLRKGMPCNPIANKVACQKIVARYHEDGRFMSFCDLTRGGQAGDTEVIFSITEGPKFRIADIQFTGNHFASSAQLKTHMQSSAKFLGLPISGTYNAAMLDHDQGEVLRYYRSFGYHDVKVGREVRYTPDGRDVVIFFHVEEGVRYKLTETPHVYGPRSITPEALEASNKMKAGEYYDQFKIDSDTTRMKDWIGMGGHETRINAVPVYPPDKPGIVQVRYEVEERPQARVGQVFIVGNDRTMQNVILRQVPLFPGQVLDYTAIAQGQRNLARLNIFETSPDGSVRPTITVLDNPADPDNPYKDVLVTVQEASTGSLMFGLGVNSDSGLTGSIVLNERNFDLFRLPTSFDDFLNGTAFRGAGQEFRVEAVPGTQLQRYTVSLREPFLFDTPYSLTVSGYYYQRLFNEYNEDRYGARASIGRKIDNFWSAVGTVRVENVNVSGVGAGAPDDYTSVIGDNFQVGTRVSAVRDSRDSVIRPTSGALFDIGYEYVAGAHSFSQATVDLTNYFTVWQRADNTGRHVLSVHNNLGWSSSDTPVYERFFGGGFRSIRGFQFRGVGPDINGFKVGGDFMVLNSLEYQIPLNAKDTISAVGFVDSGAVSRNISGLDDYRVSVGFGVRFVVPMLGPMPIALDFGFPIVKSPSDQTQVFNFFMGWTR